jgi:hypothetical protein
MKETGLDPRKIEDICVGRLLFQTFRGAQRRFVARHLPSTFPCVCLPRGRPSCWYTPRSAHINSKQTVFLRSHGHPEHRPRNPVKGNLSRRCRRCREHDTQVSDSSSGGSFFATDHQCPPNANYRRGSGQRSPSTRLYPGMRLKPPRLASVDVAQLQPMGWTAELVAQTYNVSRKKQDEYALISHTRASQVPIPSYPRIFFTVELGYRLSRMVYLQRKSFQSKYADLSSL